MLSLSSSLLLLLATGILLFLCIATYRILFHPLAKIPGPKLAAATTLYEAYYDCLVGGGGQYTFKIQELHKQYGPCVRIGPNEVHIDGQVSPHYWDVIFNYTTRMDRDDWLLYPFGAGVAMFSTRSANLHRARRGAIANYFSMSNVRSYEPMVLSNIQHLCSRLDECRKNDEVVNMSDAYRCLTTDVVTAFAIPQGNAMLSTPDFGNGFHKLIRDYLKLAHWERHLRIVFPLMMALPDWVTEMSGEGGKQLVEFFRNFERQTLIALGRKGKPPPDERMSILDTLAASPDLDESDKSFKRLIGEARTIVGAGTETLGSTLSTLTYHVACDEVIGNRLHEELATLNSGDEGLIEWKAFEKVPYLQGCINEALRLACPFSGRISRINPREAMTYKASTGDVYTFPAGTNLAMNMQDMHLNADVFPDPYTFRPERWLEATSEMQKYFVPFGKGTRSCLGMDMAKMELLLTVGNLYKRFRFELYQSTQRDICFANDFLAPFPPADSKGLRVRVKNAS